MNTPAGASKALYGFEPANIIGQPLAAVVDVFGLWRRQFTEDQSLLGLLAHQAAADMSAGIDAEGTGFISADGAAEGGAGSCCWRVGVHLPMAGDEQIVKHAEQLAEESSKGGKVSSSRLDHLLCLCTSLTAVVGICPLSHPC
jgi:hypothetical protein